MKNKRLETMLSGLSLYSLPARTASDWAEVMASLRDVKPRPIVKMFGKYPTAENVSAHAALMREWNAVYRKASASQKAALIRDNAAFNAVKRNPLKRKPTTAMFIELRNGTTGKRIGPLFDLRHTSMGTIKAAAEGYHARTGHAISAHRVKNRVEK